MKVKKQTPFDSLIDDISEGFVLQNKYCTEVSKFIDKEYKKRREQINEKLKDEEFENRGAIMKFHYHFNSDLPEMFTDTFLKSAFISCWGLFENYLKEISDLILEHYKVEKKLDSYKKINSIIKKCKEKCLEIYLNDFLIEYNSEWETIDCCNFVRNKIVHSNSIFRKTENSKLLKCNSTISVSNYDNIYSKINIKSVDFILAFNTASVTILLKLVEQMRLSIQNAP